jgi:hypothetical protein
MSPLKFMQRIPALVPRPRLHLSRCHGVLAPNAKLRCEIIPSPPEPATAPTTDYAHAQGAARRRSESIYSKRPESRNWLPTQADDAARSEFERARRWGTNYALPAAASPESSEANPQCPLDTRSIDYSPVQRYSSRRRKRVFKFPIQIVQYARTLAMLARNNIMRELADL